MITGFSAWYIPKLSKPDLIWVSILIFRSLKNYYVGLVDDTKGVTLASAAISKKESSLKLAESLADKASKLGVNKIVFDKSGYKYHGRLKEFADALRDKGFNF